MQQAMIKCLPKEVQGKLRSGIALPSLQQCVEELLVNSIDAGANCVGVRVDMDAFKIQVIDNGRGMSREDIGCVGNRYFTSKCYSLDDLEDLRCYGFRGEALASIISFASLVEISSRTKESVKTYIKIFREGTGLDVFEAETTRPSAGTTVTVCNYFNNMPVRRKRMDAVLENERIRQRIEAISLMHPSVSFSLKNDCTRTMVVQLPKARNTYYRFVQIHSLARAQKLGEFNYTSGQFEVTGYIGKEGHYNNNLQFLYINERLLLRTRIHKLLNSLLRRLSYLSQKTDSPEDHTMTRSPKLKRSQDLYGVFIVNIKCPYSEYDVCLEPAKTLIEFKDWDGILHCVEESVKDFLKRENLEAELSQDDLESESPKTEINGTTHTNTNADVGVSHFSKMDAGIDIVLSSECVHRSHTTEHSNKINCKDDDIEQQQKNLYANNKDSKLNSEPFGDKNSSTQCINLKEESTSDERCSIANEQLPKEVSSALKTSKHVLTNCAVSTASQDSFINTRKVTLSDPFVHEILQIEKQQNSGFQQGKNAFGTKRKISLGTSQETPWEEVFHGPAPVKMRKIVSLSNISQSLDQFRRIYNKPSEEPEGSKCKGFINDNSNCEKNPQCFDVTNAKEHGHSIQSPPTLTAFTKLKPVTCVIKEKRSIASKLCHLRQNKEDPCITPFPTTETTSPNNNSISGDCTQQSCNTEVNVKPESCHITSLDQTEEIQKTISDDWVPHYDSSVGKTVYVNKVTGLSKYEEPSTEQTEMYCTSDVTNMAISVLSETGMEYICYPFQMDLVLPFLPKSRAERVCWSGLDDRDISGTGDDENSNSLYSMYSKWNNPVFVRPPKVCVDISHGRADGLAVKVHNILFPYRFSKAMIPTMKVINQVDKKFLACLINTTEDLADSTSESNGNLLVLMDQHAAHERVRLENLIADAYEDDSDIPGEKRLSSSIISPPLEVKLPLEEQRILRSCQAHLQSLGLEIMFSQKEDSRIFIGKVPLCFTEKDINERRRGRPSVIKVLIEEYLREQIELLRSAGRLKGTLPLTVQKVLASFACHGAIKFNDILNKNECFSLVASLSACQLPFQCAHGRPSIAPLVDLRHIDNEEKRLQRPNLPKLRRMYKAWQLWK
ncbi:DNA mismatch repair protein Mlh3 isoform X2 [Boleophthalmus pectinirostris]|uniref:DNA mismatch repair protein Mlh3 isoform X2 n=1 Tax=Boleophthalmus pectinirostris TaxID=150288 RepID=UPI00242A85B2|nr:DNA mismatch repair protein Mlh3 isoform X2 [Boleophthalmus pectinirostris]